MSASPTPTAAAALSRTTSPVNYLFLVEGCVAVIVAVAFLFYWNRVLGNGLSWFIRLYAWRKHNAYINIGSLQISPLAGRILFRDVHYHSSNLSLRVLHGHVTWRYWKRRVRQEGQARTSKRKLLPCRISIFAEGVELFVFNRTPAYDAIVERMEKHEAEDAEDVEVDFSDGQPRMRKGYADPDPDSPPSSKERWSDEADRKAEATRTRSNADSSARLRHSETLAPKPMISWFREMLPVELDILTGAIVLGNDATPMVLVIDFKEGDGTVEASPSRSPLDYYKFGVNLSFRSPKILMRTNTDYTGPLLNHGKRMYDKLSEESPEVLIIPPSKLSLRQKFRQLASKLSFLHTPEAPSMPSMEHGPWKGLARYREDANGTGAFGRASHEIEYAKVTTLLDSPAVDVSFFYDEPGNVLPTETLRDTYSKTKREDWLGNGDEAPEYGIDVVVHGGSVKYGPWADRQRDALQKAFAPSIFFNSEPHPKLRPGDKRVATALKINIRLDEETVLRLPTREFSKDWQYDTRRGYHGRIRPYGWLDVKVGADSYITYVQSQVATVAGYDSQLELHLDGITIVTSVNMQTFMTADVCRLSLSMPTPLRWNEERTWGFDVTMDRPEIFLLRDHVTLIADLAKDWSSGSTGDFFHFVPNHYEFQVALKNYALRMNLNDYNIVDRPTSLEDNAFAHLTGPVIGANVKIDAGKYRAELSTIPFTVNARDATLCLSVPQWDTHASFETGRTTDIGRIGDIEVIGSYLYYATFDPSHQETLTLDIKIAFKCLGWVLRRLFAIKDNYFGAYTNFTTFSEFSDRFAQDPKLVGDRVEEKYRPGRSDSFAVNLTVRVHDSRVLLPENIFDCLSGVCIPVPEFQMTLRSLDELMEMSIDLQPTYLSCFDNVALVYPFAPLPAYDPREVVFIEGVEVKAHRLFGPQPRASTYLCLWEIRLAAVQAHLTPRLAHKLQNIGRAFRYNFTDVENAPSDKYVPPPDPDVTFFKLGIEVLDATLLDPSLGTAAMRASLPSGLQLDTSSLSTRSFASLLALSIPAIRLTCLARPDDRRKWSQVGSAAADLQLDVYKKPRDWRNQAVAQHDYVAQQDEPTRRAEALYTADRKGAVTAQGVVHLPQPDADKIATLKDCMSDTTASTFLTSDTESTSNFRSNRRSLLTARESHSGDSIGVESGEESDFSCPSDSSSARRRESTADDERLQWIRGLYSKNVPPSTYEDDVEPQGMPVPESWGNHRADLSVVRVRSKRGIQVEATAEAATATAELVEGMSKVVPTTETFLDKLLDSQVDARVAVRKSKSVSTLIDVALPTIVCRVQSAGSESDDKADQSEDMDVYLRVLKPCILLESRSEKLAGSLRFTGHIPSAALQLSSRRNQGLAIDLQDAGKAPVLPIHLGDFLAGYIALTSLSIQAGQSNVNTVTVDCQTIDLQSVHQSIILLRSAIKYVDFVTQRPNGGSGASQRMLQEDLACLLHEAIQGGYSTVNPKFMDVESSSLHSEDDANLRRCLGWMTLARFRQWLRVKEPGCRQARASSGMPFNADGIVRRLANLKEWEPVDREDVYAQSFLQIAFPDLRPAIARKLPQVALHARLGAFDVAMHGIDVSAKSVVTSTAQLRNLTVGMIFRNQLGRDVLAIGVETIGVSLATNLVHLAQVFQSCAGDRSTAEKPKGDDNVTNSTSTVQGVLSVHAQRTILEVNASGLKAALIVDLLAATVAARARQSKQAGDEVQTDYTHSVMAETIQIRADGDTLGETARPAVRSLVQLSLRGVHWFVDFPAVGGCGVILSFAGVELLSKPRLKSLVSYVDDWRERHFETYRDAFAEMSRVSGASAVHTASTRRRSEARHRKVTFDVRLVQANIRIRASKALWLAWEIEGSVGSIERRSSGGDIAWSYAVKIGSQALGVAGSAKHQLSDRPQSDSATLLRLPWVQLGGSQAPRAPKRSAEHIVSLSLGQISGTAKPALLERLLSMYEHLRHDVQAVVDLQEKIHQVVGPSGSSAPLVISPEARATPTYEVCVAIRGLYFAVRADGVASLIVLKAAALTGKVTNCSVPQQVGLAWSAHARDLTLALGRSTRVDARKDAPDAPFDSRHCSAYMILSAQAQELPSIKEPNQRTIVRDASLDINITPVHTVMHVTAMGEILDLAKKWSAELSGLHSRRATELAEIRSQTTRVLKNLEPAVSAPADSSWFALRTVKLQLAGIGIAVPLVEVNVMADGPNGQVPAFPALLLAIHSLSYTNRRNETARSTIQHLTLQFVTKFDQLNSEHFKSLSHQSKNKMSLPDLESQAQMSQHTGHWEVYAHSTASGFQLSLAPNITDHVFALLDLYDTGKLRFALLEAQYRQDLATLYALESATAVESPPPPTQTAPHTSSMRIRASFIFNSGLVAFHPPQTIGQTAAREVTDTLRLPSISVWADFKGSDTVQDLDTLLVNTAVHASANDINPTVLPFCHAIVRQVSAHLNSGPEREARRRPHLLQLSSPASDDALKVDSSLSEDVQAKRTKYEVSLRIDRSKLRFHCLDGSKAFAALEWESGGFIVTHLAGPMGSSTLAGTVTGVSVSLGHTFRSETSFMSGQGKDLTFSVIAGPRLPEEPLTINVVADTELLVSLNMGLYFACLGFIAVWWDTMPAVQLRRAQAQAAEAGVAQPLPPPSSATVFDFLLRARLLEFDADVAISKGTFRLQSLVAEGSLGPVHKELRLSVGGIQGQASGDVAGKVENTGLTFRSHRQAYEAGKQVSNPVFLDMAVDTGETELRLDVDHQSILRAHIANTIISLADDWSSFVQDQSGGRSLKLAFGVDAGRVDGVLVLLAIPQLLRRVNAITDIMDDQLIQAANDSPAFRTRRTNKNQTASRGIAAAMLQSAKEHAKDFTPSNLKVVQAVRFDLAGIDLGVYSQDIHESDFYRFKVGRVGADQLRDINASGQPDRRIDLMVAYMTWETSDPGRPPKDSDNELPVSKWIERAASHDSREVASLPALTLTMNSTELSHPPVLEYDFDLIWGETDGDIAFLPNFFDAFKKAFEQLISELDQVKVEQLAESQRRARLAGLEIAREPDAKAAESKKAAKDQDELALLVYHNRSTNPQHNLPRLKPLGEGTTDAARLLPMIKTGMAQIPIFSHRFVTLKLEELMSVMLKLYEKQLDVAVEDA